MLDKTSSQPLYEQIKDYILSGIASGEYAPHKQLPSERQLSDLFEVSRLTVSKAIKQLVQDGRLYVQIGKGTYVADALIQQQVDTLTSFTEEMENRGQRTTSKVLRAVVAPASSEMATVLSIPTGANIVELKRVRYVAQRAMAIESASINAALCPDILEIHNFSHESLYDVLRNTYNVLLVLAEQTFEARVANADEATLLEIKPGAPVLAIHRVTYTDEGKACEEVKSVYRGDRYKFRARLSGSVVKK